MLQKRINWHLLNKKVFGKLPLQLVHDKYFVYQMSEEQIEGAVKALPGAIERIILQVKIVIEYITYSTKLRPGNKHLDEPSEMMKKMRATTDQRRSSLQDMSSLSGKISNSFFSNDDSRNKRINLDAYLQGSVPESAGNHQTEETEPNTLSTTMMQFNVNVSFNNKVLKVHNRDGSEKRIRVARPTY